MIQEIWISLRYIKSIISDKDIHFIFNIDEKIIGGVVIEIEDVVYDYSVRRLLTELKSSISENNWYILYLRNCLWI